MTWLGPVLLIYVVGVTLFLLSADLYEHMRPRLRYDPTWPRTKRLVSFLWPIAVIALPFLRRRK